MGGLAGRRCDPALRRVRSAQALYPTGVGRAAAFRDAQGLGKVGGRTQTQRRPRHLGAPTRANERRGGTGFYQCCARICNAMECYHVRARNTAPDSENKMHDNRTAAAYGFRGGLVPGVTVYGYLTVPVIHRFGVDWLAKGGMRVRF